MIFQCSHDKLKKCWLILLFQSILVRTACKEISHFAEQHAKNPPPCSSIALVRVSLIFFSLSCCWCFEMVGWHRIPTRLTWAVNRTAVYAVTESFGCPGCTVFHDLCYCLRAAWELGHLSVNIANPQLIWFKWKDGGVQKAIWRGLSWFLWSSCDLLEVYLW